MACPITRNLVLNFAPPSPAPANGYRVKWRVVGTTNYTTATGPFTSSPITLTAIPACENIEGTIEGSCSSTAFTAPASFSASKVTALVCGSTVSRTNDSAQFYVYPKELIDLAGTTDTTITVNWVSNEVPNRINVYDSTNNLLVTTGWVGVAAGSGPWGASLNTPTNGSITFQKSAGDGRFFTINAEHAGVTGTTDNWQATISCNVSAPSATYAIAPNVTTVNEGGTVTFNVTTTNVANGTTLYYSIAGVSAADFSDNVLTGSITINNNTGSFTKTLANDTTTEGTETFTASLRITSISGEVKATSASVSVADTSVSSGGGGAGGESGGGGGGGVSTPTYSVSPSTTSVNEGGTVTFTVTTTNVPNGTTLYYTSSGSAVSADFTDGFTFGTVVINNNTGSITRTITNDVTTEGSENFTLVVRTDSSAGPVVATAAQVTINDTSTTPSSVTYYNATRCDNGGAGTIQYNGGNNLTAGVVVKNQLGVCYTIVNVSSGTEATSGYIVSEHSDCNDCTGGGQTVSPTYAIAPNVTSVNEGGSVTFTVTTTSVPDGTTLYWVTDGGMGVSAGDFSDGALTGQVTINSNTGSIVRSIVSDSSTEGAETFYLDLKTGGTSGPTQATSATVTIGDTSTTPVTTFNVGVALNAGSAGTVDCLGDQYSTSTNFVTATLYNNSGVPVNATSNITVTFNRLYTPCFGGASSVQQGTVVIPAGQSTADSEIWTSSTIVDCGQFGCQQETIQYDCAASNSAGFNWAVGTTVCNNT